jgi:hypothetical protein
MSPWWMSWNEIMPISFVRIVAIAGVLLAGALIMIAHRRRPDLPASQTALSIYFTDPTRAIMTSAYAAIAGSLVFTAFVIGINTHTASLVAAVACCICALFLIPVVATTQRHATVVRSDAIRRTHRYAAATAFASAGVAMAASSICAAMEGNTSIAMLGAAGVVLVSRTLMSTPGPTHGLRQKQCLVVLGLWIVATAITG